MEISTPQYVKPLKMTEEAIELTLSGLEHQGYGKVPREHLLIYSALSNSLMFHTKYKSPV